MIKIVLLILVISVWGSIAESQIEDNVKIYVENRETKQQLQTDCSDSNLTQKVNISKPVVFLVHGWSQDHTKPWIQNFVQKWLLYFDTNVILIDWKPLANLTYWDSVNAIPKVANYTSKFLQCLVDKGISLDNVHLIGDSMGAHLCGHVGASFGGQIANITGLDPAGPLFTTPFKQPDSEILDESDAIFVQVIYSTYGTIASNIPLGHENHFVNYGLFLQPNCFTLEALDEPNTAFLWCSHGMAHTIFVNSLDPNCVFIGSSCFIRGLGCAEERAGISTSGKSGNFYFTTGFVAPFCQNQ